MSPAIYVLLGITTLISITTMIVVLLRKPCDYSDDFAQLREKTDANATAVETVRHTVETSSAVTREAITGQATAVSNSLQGVNSLLTDQFAGFREENRNNTHAMQTMISEQVGAVRADSAKAVDMALQLNENINRQNTDNTKRLSDTVHDEMSLMRADMQAKLDEIRHTVDEQLQTNLDKKLNESFRTVSEQLMAVQQGLGQMNSLASDVGDLRKTLSSVKTRGIWGEVQLGAILSEILTPDQYDTNVATVPHASERVEFAIKLPGQGNGHVYLPIDSKFPGDTYNKLLDAYESGEPAKVDAAWKALEAMLNSEARDIRTKYVHVPDTTDFAIMFLPVEGLYAEAVKHGLIETFQSKYKVNIAGPTTMAALLNSLQMGFKTLQIQKQSSEVWTVLQNTKAEFEKYAAVLGKVQTRLKQTEDELENLVGYRTRILASKLAKVEQYNATETPEISEKGTE